MQEEVENKTVNLAVSTAKLTGRTLVGAFRTYLYHRNNVKTRQAIEKGNTAKVIGKQKVKELIGRGDGVSAIEIADGSARDFCKVAKKYGVDYAIKKDKTVDPPRYTVFFKAKDAEVLQQVLKDYTARTMKQEKKLSILEKLKEFREKTAEKQQTKQKSKQKQRERTKGKAR